jgi:RNA polymerase sigma-70 factor (ECF subfamily)
MSDESKESSAAADAAMERYAAGDESAFASVYDCVAPKVWGYLRRRTPSVERAEDLVQQTFLHMHRARGTFIPGAEVVPWACAIARRLLIDAARRDKRIGRLTESAGDEVLSEPALHPIAEELVHARELTAKVQGALVRLPESQRVAFELVREQGFSLSQAAQVLGVTTAAVKQRAHRAYLAVRAALEDEVS